MARACVGQISFNSSQRFRPSLPKASSRIFLPRAARSSLIDGTPWMVAVVAVGKVSSLLFNLDVSRARDLGPFLDLGLDEGGRLCRIEIERFETELAQAR